MSAGTAYAPVDRHGHTFTDSRRGTAALAVHPADDNLDAHLVGSNSADVSHIGSDLLQSVALAEGMSQTLKVTTRRERPDGSGRNSFPSGHAADTFAPALRQ